MKKEFNLEELFSKAKESSTSVSSADAIGRFNESLAGNTTVNTVKRSQFFTKKNIIMIVTTLVVSVSILVGFSLKEKEESTTTTPVEISEVTRAKETTHSLTEESSKEKQMKKKPIKGFSISPLSIKEINAIHVSKFDIIEMDRGINRRSKSVNFPADQKYYPKLTPDEIKENHKQKKKMLKALAKFDKKSYAYIPSGSMKMGGQSISVQAFYMGVNEVTNLEYRTFMFDLIIQGRKSEFDTARPEQDRWNFFLDDTTNSMEKTYFSHPAYNDYPVVNITKEGVELYCKWLTLELVKLYGNEFNDVRIPVKDEWMFAASAEGKVLPYPWGTDQIKNELGCFLANFDTNSDFPKNGSVLIERDGAMFTAKTGTYNPNERGLYNLAGNVAELAFDSKRDEKGEYILLDKLVQCGGGWMDSADELKIDAPKKPFVGATPNVGFRVVMTHLNSNIK